MLDQTANPHPPSAPPTPMLRSPPCLLHSPILSLACSLPPCLCTCRAQELSSSSPICRRRASVPTPRPMSRWTFRGSHTATACRRPIRSPLKTTIRRTSSSSKLESAALRSEAGCKTKKVAGSHYTQSCDMAVQFSVCCFWELIKVRLFVVAMYCGEQSLCWSYTGSHGKKNSHFIKKRGHFYFNTATPSLLLNCHSFLFI